MRKNNYFGPYEKYDEYTAAMSYMPFIFTTIYLFTTNKGYFSLFTLKAFGFSIVAGFIITLSLSALFYLLGRGAFTLLLKVKADLLLSKGGMSVLQRITFVLIATQMGATVYATNFAYNKLIHEDKYAVTVSPVPVEIICKESIIPFSLGSGSRPNTNQINKLCACIWSNLNDSEKETSRESLAGRQAVISLAKKQAFVESFGKLVRKCGGMGI